jgi:AcrR family transcriptional regulator
MNQEERSERSRAIILDAALELFSHQGYRATSIRDIAAKANVSTGSVYHHFKDKEELFDTLLGRFRSFVESPEFPLYKALARGIFPDRLEEVGQICRDIVSAHRAYIALIYVDVVEFEGLHIRGFYQGMASLCEHFIAAHKDKLPIAERLKPDVPAAAAMLLTFRTFVDFFVVELIFGVPTLYGMSSDDAIKTIATVIRRGILTD